MNMVDVLAIIAVPLIALGVLPGTLGVLMLTNRIAASPAGARYIYSQSLRLMIQERTCSCGTNAVHSKVDHDLISDQYDLRILSPYLEDGSDLGHLTYSSKCMS